MADTQMVFNEDTITITKTYQVKKKGYEYDDLPVELFNDLDDQYDLCEGAVAFYTGNFFGHIGDRVWFDDEGGNEQELLITHMDIPTTLRILQDGNIIQGAVMGTEEGQNIYICVEGDIWLMDKDGEVLTDGVNLRLCE